MASELRTNDSPATLAPADPARPRRRSIGGKLRLPRRRPLREGVETAFSRMLRVARRSARSAADDPVAAVHEFRKSIRRGRAVVALLAPTLGRKATARLVARMRKAFAVTSAFRDADILLETLASVPPVPEDDLARHAIQVALELEQRRTHAETAETLARGLSVLTPLPFALDVVLDPDFSVHDLERGLQRSRRRERRTLDRARESRSPEDVHEWRKRVKELRYQVELLSSAGSRELKKREKKLADLAQELGSVTDLTVLAREIEKRSQDGGIPPAPQLLARIRSLAASRSTELLERGASLFEPDPKAFARQVLAERG
jgi:CHAD domain-containing protein